MKLRDKFEPFVYFCDGNNSMERQYQREDNAKECEKIAEDFAIRFLEFVHVNCEEDWGSDNYLYDEESYTIRELLEVFKKERNL